MHNEKKIELYFIKNRTKLKLIARITLHWQIDE